MFYGKFVRLCLFLFLCQLIGPCDIKDILNKKSRFSSDNFLNGISEARKPRTKECEPDGTRLMHREEFGLKNTNGISFGRQGVDEGIVLTD